MILTQEYIRIPTSYKDQLAKVCYFLETKHLTEKIDKGSGIWEDGYWTQAISSIRYPVTHAQLQSR